MTFIKQSKKIAKKIAKKQPRVVKTRSDPNEDGNLIVI